MAIGTERDLVKALNLYSQAATESNNRAAQYLLRLMYYHDEGVRKNYKKALKWLLLAARQGWRNAMALMGDICREGGYAVEKDYKKAAFWYVKVGREKDDIYAILKSGADDPVFELFGCKEFSTKIGGFDVFVYYLSLRWNMSRSETISSSAYVIKTTGMTQHKDLEHIPHVIFWMTSLEHLQGADECQLKLGDMYTGGGKIFR